MKKLTKRNLGKIVTSGIYFDDISHSLHCDGCKWHVSKYIFQEPQSKYQNLFQDSSYPLATDKAEYKPNSWSQINQRFCYKANN